jgi:hypothetical protein
MKKQILLFLLLLSTSTYAQKRDEARSNILMLKNGALFVRLKTSELKISALKKNGMAKEAEEVRVNQESTNKLIVAAFKEKYTFGKVFFFYSNYSNQVKEGNYKGCLMNVNMEIDSSFSGPNYLIGEFDESATTQLDAFYVKDKNYVQLSRPFPFLVKQNEMVVSTRSYEKIVSILNGKFSEFYGN